MKKPRPAPDVTADASGLFVKVPLRPEAVKRAQDFMGAVQEVSNATKTVEEAAEALLSAILHAADLMRLDTRKARRVVAEIQRKRRR